MINLLSEESKKELRAARSNVTLLNYMLILGLGVIFLAIISGGVYFVLLGTQSDAQNLISASQAKSSAYSSVEAQGSSLRASLTSAKTILDQEVLYTKVLTNIAGAMPTGVILDSLNLNPTLFGTPVTLQFYTKTTKQALALKDSLATSPMFSNISFLSLSSSGSQSVDYPISVSLSLSINKDVAK
ncbi:MAG: Fimbrial assembly family protein [Candidatus Saccharibacteria bacterium]|jgi:Tfp pilus assembly protein PilN|nr:Fimbrial assembly family protein [Candidatus Saccharibacteria bacterium]